MLTLVASALAGSDCIDDADALRAGETAQVLARAWGAGAGPGNEPLTIDLDSTVCETYGLAKAGAQRHNYAGQRGYHPLLAVAAGTSDVLMAPSSAFVRSTTPNAWPLSTQAGTLTVSASDLRDKSPQCRRQTPSTTSCNRWIWA